MTNVSEKETPWAVICQEHGQVFLTEQQYNYQMSHPNRLWQCPICLEDAQWDDDNYEKHLNEDEVFEDGTPVKVYEQYMTGELL